MKPAIAIDFDGTITEDGKFPTIGKEQLWLVRWCDGMSEEELDMVERDGIHVIKEGAVYAPATFVIRGMMNKYDIIIFTCRTGASQKAAIEWLASVAHTKMFINHDYTVNNNPHCPEAYEKPFADVYLDNRGMTWHSKLPVEKAIESLIGRLPVHTYIPQK